MLVLWWIAGCVEEKEADPGSTLETSSPTGDDDDDTPVACVPDPVPEGASLTLSLFGGLELVPGATLDLSLQAVVNGGYIVPVDLCEDWSVDPDGLGVSVDSEGGVTVDPSTPDGTEVTVTAERPDGTVTTVELLVYDPVQRPWVGNWQEVAQIDCVTGEERVPEEALGEVRFKASGEALLTWQPFELYVDWWGDASWDAALGTVSMASTGGNYVPSDIDGEGSFVMEGEEMVLRDLWLGSPQDALAPAGCGHRLN